MVSVAGAPLISVCMPVRQCERYVGEAIQSVLDQSLADFELVIFDNASTDRTYEVARSFDDSRLRIHRNSTNIGAQANWNLALAAAKGKFIKLLPGDDRLYPGCLERQADIITQEQYRDVVLVCCARDIVDRNGRTVVKPRFPGRGVIDGKALIRRTVRYGTNIIGEPGAVLFRANVARRVGPFDASLAFVMDLDYWARLLQYGNAYLIPDALCAFRISGQNWSVELGRDRRTQYLRFLDKLTDQERSISGFDRWIGRAMAMVNEVLRQMFYRYALKRAAKAP